MAGEINRRTFLKETAGFLGAIGLISYNDLFKTSFFNENKFEINNSGEIFSIENTSYPDYFEVLQGNNLNLLYQSKKLASNIVITSRGKNRIVFAFPAGNSSFSIWFEEKLFSENSGLVMELEGKLKEVKTKKENTFILFSVKTNKKKVVITDYIVDSVRSARDKTDDPHYKRLERVTWREEFKNNNPSVKIPASWVAPEVNIIKADKDQSLVTFHRTTLDEKYGVYSEILFPENTEVSIDKDGYITIISGENITFQIMCTSTFPSLTPFSREELINKNFLENIKTGHVDVTVKNDKLLNNLKEYTKYYSSSLRDLLFLSYNESYLAGSWRFLTYFGRDTMMTTMILGEILTGKAYESAMESILDRMSPLGDVAHEDNSWWQAEGERVWEYNRLCKENRKEEGEKLLEIFYDQNYDYKMIDDDFMFPIMLSYYFKRSDLSEKEKDEFVNKINFSKVLNKETDNRLSIMRNFNYVLKKTVPYYKNYKELISGKNRDELSINEMKKLASCLVRLNENCPVGDWRNSNTGLGRGVYSGNVNLYLVPASLKSIYEFLRRDINGIKEMAEKNNLTYLLEILNTFSDGESRYFEELIDCWKKCKDHFKVTLKCEEIRERVKTFVNENEEMTPSFAELLLSLPVTYNESVTIGRFIKGETPNILKDGLSYYSLSLDEDLNPVEIINSDVSFGLFLDEMSSEDVKEVIKVVSLNYPIGLMTEGGSLTASPSLNKDKELWKIFTTRAYHGTVVWSWQMAFLEKGLLYQGGKMESLNSKLSSDIFSLAAELLRIENTLGEMRNFELWSIKGDEKTGKIVPVPYGEGTDTESNALQLWSTLALSMAKPY